MSMLLRNSVSRTAFTAAPGALALRQQPARLYATEGARPAESHVKPQAPGKTPSFFKRISVEVTPLIGFVSVLLCIAAGAAVHHLTKDDDLRIVDHKTPLVDEMDGKLQEALKQPGGKK